ncbi:hypothetical protein [Sphingomonas hylomeconis]|uniref:Uncharacterized protein n=1 Tax=Sphingomonas hylomeconis TaxID=1395958 RepID=A0ABV7STW0_9SPHN|nr:hypothetical protein [Sphingomonas hylomeconis]
MRLISLAVSTAALIAAAPAAANERAAPSVDQVARALADPQVQAGVATVLDAFAGTVLDTRVGPLAHYTDKVRPDDTLRDVARRGDPAFDRHLQERTRGAVALAGRTAQDAATMQAELARTAARLRDLMATTSAVLDAVSTGQ